MLFFPPNHHGKSFLNTQSQTGESKTMIKVNEETIAEIVKRIVLRNFPSKSEQDRLVLSP